MNRPSYLLFKKCNKCGEILHISKFYKNKGCKYGVVGTCKKCSSKSGKEYYKKNREDILIKKKKYNEEHKEERREYHKQYREDNKEYLKEYNKNYYEENKEERKEYNDKYYEENKEYILNKRKDYYEENKEEIKEYRKKYYEENKEYFSNYGKEYHKEHREKRLEYGREWRNNNRDYAIKYAKENQDKIFNSSNKRRLTEQNQGNGITKEQWLEMMNFFNWTCAYSGEFLGGNNKDRKRTIDHIVALDNGGENEVWNCVPMLSNYNSSKKTRDMLEWYLEQEYFDIDRLTKIYEWRIYAYWKWNEI